MLDTYDSLVRSLILRCPSASYMLARQWIDHAFRQLWDYKTWSWQRKRGQFLMNQVVNSGTVSVVFGQLTVQGVGTTWTTDLVNRQFRTGFNSPIFTIVAVDATNQILTLDAPYANVTTASIGYNIYNAYVTVPTDFQNFITVWDPAFNWQLQLNVTQEELNAWDAQRANSGTAYVVATYGYDSVNTPPLPMYEIWPHQRAQYVYPFLYFARMPDLSEPGASLPRYIRGDLLLEGALVQAARWPGAAEDSRNPYFNLNLSTMHETRFLGMLVDIARTDDEVISNTVSYLSLSAMPFATMPGGDSRFLQNHDL